MIYFVPDLIKLCWRNWQVQHISKTLDDVCLQLASIGSYWLNVLLWPWATLNHSNSCCGLISMCFCLCNNGCPSVVCTSLWGRHYLDYYHQHQYCIIKETLASWWDFKIVLVHVVMLNTKFYWWETEERHHQHYFPYLLIHKRDQKGTPLKLF